MVKTVLVITLWTLASSLAQGQKNVPAPGPLVPAIQQSAMTGAANSNFEPSLFNPYIESPRPLAQPHVAAHFQQPTGSGVLSAVQLEAEYRNQSPANLSGSPLSSSTNAINPPAPQPWNIVRQRESFSSRWLTQEDRRRQLPQSLDIQIRGLVMTRDHAANQALTTNAADAVVLSTRDADMDSAGGPEITLGKTLEDGNRRIEVVYWGLFTQGDSATAADPAGGLNTLLNIDGLSYNGFGNSLANVFDGSENQTLTRSFEYHNVEWNLTGVIRSEDGKQTVQWLAGLRYLKANDRFNLDVDEVVYSVSNQNHLFGIQVGALGHWQKNGNLTYHAGVKAGLFGNAIDHRTQILGAAGYAFIEDPAIPNWRDDFNEYSNKNDVSFLGQLEFGFDYLMSKQCKLTAGYRILGLTGIAFATDQIPLSFADAATGQSVTADGSLILHGAYMGIDWNY